MTGEYSHERNPPSTSLPLVATQLDTIDPHQDILPCNHVRKNAFRLLTEYASLPEQPTDLLFEHYCSITKKIIDAHFQSIDPLQHWADPYILLHPAFGTILAQVKAGATIFDHSDYFATDLRALAMHGAPTKKMLTYNSSAARWALSHEAFRDKGRFSITCLDGSAYLNPSKKWYVNDPFLPYRGSVDILWLPHRVYGLERAEQRSSILGLIERFRPTAGFMLVGCHEGSKVTRYEKRTGALGVREDAWIPNAEDFGKMLQEVLTPADGEWQVEVSLIELDQTEEFREYAAVKGKELLRFTCVRLD